MLKLTEAQISALETAGVFECDDPLAAFIKGNQIEATEESKTLVNELSNHLDDLGHGRDVTDEEARKWYRRDARALANLFVKM